MKYSMINEFPNFLTQDECDTLIALGESGNLKTGKTSDRILGYRKAKVRWFSDHPLVERIKKEVSVLSETDLEKQEEFHFVKYESRGEYKEHVDGGSRTKTALIYLNTGFIGGETIFTKVGRKIVPEVGKLVVWNNLDQNGDSNELSTHAGLPVEFGTKYIAVIWIKK